MVEETEENSIRDLRAVPHNTFQDAFQKCKKTVGRCVSRVEGSTLKVTSLNMLLSEAINLKKMFGLFMDCSRMLVVGKVQAWNAEGFVG